MGIWWIMPDMITFEFACLKEENCWFCNQSIEFLGGAQIKGHSTMFGISPWKMLKLSVSSYSVNY